MFLLLFCMFHKDVCFQLNSFLFLLLLQFLIYKFQGRQLQIHLKKKKMRRENVLFWIWNSKLLFPFLVWYLFPFIPLFTSLFIPFHFFRSFHSLLLFILSFLPTLYLLQFPFHKLSPSDLYTQQKAIQYQVLDFQWEIQCHWQNFFHKLIVFRLVPFQYS